MKHRIVLAILLLASLPLAAQEPLGFDDPAQEARYKALTEELRCTVCQNQNLADSDAPLAQDLRKEIHKMMTAGRSDAEIKTFLVERYGDFVLYRPRMNAANFLLWAAPALLLLIGGGAAVRFIRRRTAEVDEDDAGSGAGRV
jgi:cytochrome c-type biogenesis protein CcmH